MGFVFDASGITKSTSLVVFEPVSYDVELPRQDIEDKDQTVTIAAARYSQDRRYQNIAVGCSHPYFSPGGWRSGVLHLEEKGKRT